MVAGLIVIAIVLIYAIYSIGVEFTPQVPPIRDYERYNRESVTMSKEEIKAAMKAGRWS